MESDTGNLRSRRARPRSSWFPCGPRLESSLWPPTIRRSREQEARAADCFLASFTEDPSGEEARRFALVLPKTGARVFWVDAPAKANLQPLTSLRSGGWKVAELDVEFGELGEPTNTRRRIVAACRDDLEPWSLDDLASLCAPPRESSWLEKAKAIPDGAWISGDREFFTGKILPSPSGHLSHGHIKPIGRLKDGPGGQYYFDPSKQLPTLRKTSWQEGGEALLFAQGGTVRRIRPTEVWRFKGGSTPAWRAALAEGHTRDELATWAVRTPSPGTASVGAAWCASTLRNLLPQDRGGRHAGVCPLPDEEEAWAALKGWLAARSMAEGIRRVGGPKKRKGVPPDDNSDPNQLSRILVSLLRTRVVELQGNPGGWVPLQTVIGTVASRRTGASPPTLDEIRAAIVASENRLDLQTTGDSGEYLIRACMGYTGGTSLAYLGQALASHEPWMLHATFLKHVPAIWSQGLAPRGAPVRRGHSPRQHLYLGLGSDPGARFPNPRTHPCSKLTEGRNVLFWINWGGVGEAEARRRMRVTT